MTSILFLLPSFNYKFLKKIIMFSQNSGGSKSVPNANSGVIFGFDIRSLDVFPKTMDDFRIKTTSGAIGK